MSLFTLGTLNAASVEVFVAQLEGIYEHSPWVAERVAALRPFSSWAALKCAMVTAVREAGVVAQQALLCAHPELAGKARVGLPLTVESSQEQGRVGLAHCTSSEFAQIQQLNTDYKAKFGWPFILAVRGPRGTGLTRAQIIAAFARRLDGHPAFELAECLRQVHRIAELRLHDRAGIDTGPGQRAWDWAEQLATYSDDADGLTVTYLTQAHRACAQQIAQWMKVDCGFDEVAIDAVANVVGRYHGTHAENRSLLTGSHYDTVRNGGKYDGRLGILVPMAVVQALHRAGRRLPFGLEVVAFSEEEGQRFKLPFLGSSALTGNFNPSWLAQCDANGVSLSEAMRHAGLRVEDIPGLARDPTRYLGFIEVHVEQGPVLNGLDLPLGIVTAINGSVRYQGEVTGLASHAGTTPMDQRLDAATAVAELALYLERRASSVPDLVATMGMLQVPGGSINVVPGRCQFSLDIRAPSDTVRDACDADVRSELARICERRGLRYQLDLVLNIAAAPSAREWQRRWVDAVSHLGLPTCLMPSGAGHDAMIMHRLLPQAMLFVRGENAGISHNPLESTTSDDMNLAVQAFSALLDGLVTEQTARHDPA